MNIIQLYEDYGVDFRTEGHKHCRPGWVNCVCPFCSGNPGYHLGFSINGNNFVCWRCGSHPLLETIGKILQIKQNKAKQILIEYKGTTIQHRKEPRIISRVKKLKMPTGVQPLTASHRIYLENRKFCPDMLMKEWGLQSTGPTSMLDGKNYKNRIFIPIYWENELVSFQTRLPRQASAQQIKYKACPEQMEVIPHKKIIYMHPKSNTQQGICVEGVTDVWRMGKNSFATFGIKFTQAQIREITKRYKRVMILFDSDPQAQLQAKVLKQELNVRGIESFIYSIKGDPGDLSSKQAKEINEIMMTYETTKI